MSGASKVQRRVAGVAIRVAERVGARRLAYALRNRATFTDLYQHDRMLADRVRLDAYHAGLNAHVRRGDVVVDLGTGTGVLAFLAARAGARVVHGIEHGPMIELARELAAANRIGNVELHRMHSRRFSLPERADVIVHEQIGDALFDEQVVANIVDLRERVLAPGGRILPGRLQLFIEPIQLAEGFRAPYAWQQTDLYGLDFSALAALRDRQPHGYRYRVFRPLPFERFLCDPEPVLTVDLHAIAADGLPRRIAYERRVERGGWFDGFCVYFAAWFDDQLGFSSSPDGPGTNWATPLLRVASRRVEPGEAIRLDLRAADLADPRTWRWDEA